MNDRKTADHATRKQQIVVVNRPKSTSIFLPARVNTFESCLQHRDILIAGKNAANRRGDIGRGQSCPWRLDKKWLKEMIVLTVDDGDAHILIAAQTFGSVQAGKSTAGQ